MASTTNYKLHGEAVSSLKISTSAIYDGVPTLARRRYALEMAVKDRVETATHPDLPGVKMYFMYEAPAVGRSMATTPLENAKLRSAHNAAVVLSRAGATMLVVSSVLGYDTTRVVSLDREEERLRRGIYLPLDRVDFVDYAMAERAHLLSEHLGRLSLLGGDPMNEYVQEDADRDFRAIIQRTQEVA